MLDPYYSEDGITIYCGDSRDILPYVYADTVITDPPWGVALPAERPAKMRKHQGATYTYGDDTEQYVTDVCVPIVVDCIEKCSRVVVTTGKDCIFLYPRPDTIWALYWPNGAGRGKWKAFNCWTPVLCYGQSPKRNGSIPDTFKTCEQADANGHPCPKPLNIWKKLLVSVVDTDDVILDPFMGSGTTLCAARDAGHQAVGIEIEEQYCEIAVKRLAQKALF